MKTKWTVISRCTYAYTQICNKARYLLKYTFYSIPINILHRQRNFESQYCGRLVLRSRSLVAGYQHLWEKYPSLLLLDGSSIFARSTDTHLSGLAVFFWPQYEPTPPWKPKMSQPLSTLVSLQAILFVTYSTYTCPYCHKMYPERT